jgi:glycolate oxidase
MPARQHHPLVVYDATTPQAPARTAFGQIIIWPPTRRDDHRRARSRAAQAAWLPGYLGPDLLALNKRVKAALDPAGILNPGALF